MGISRLSWGVAGLGTDEHDFAVAARQATPHETDEPPTGEAAVVEDARVSAAPVRVEIAKARRHPGGLLGALEARLLGLRRRDHAEGEVIAGRLPGAAAIGGRLEMRPQERDSTGRSGSSRRRCPHAGRDEVRRCPRCKHRAPAPPIDNPPPRVAHEDAALAIPLFTSREYDSPPALLSSADSISISSPLNPPRTRRARVLFKGTAETPPGRLDGRRAPRSKCGGPPCARNGSRYFRLAHAPARYEPALGHQEVARRDVSP